MTPSTINHAAEAISFDDLRSLAVAKSPCITAAIAIPDPLQLRAHPKCDRQRRNETEGTGRFQIRPLVSLMSRGQKFYVLALSQKHTRALVHLPEPAGSLWDAWRLKACRLGRTRASRTMSATIGRPAALRLER